MIQIQIKLMAKDAAKFIESLENGLPSGVVEKNGGLWTVIIPFERKADAPEALKMALESLQTMLRHKSITDLRELELPVGYRELEWAAPILNDRPDDMRQIM